MYKRQAKNKGWLEMMYKVRKLWAAASQYGNNFLGMRSNQRSESLNSSLHRHLHIYMSLVDLVEHYDNCVCRLREIEAYKDSVASQSRPVPIIEYTVIEVAASHIFTRTNFFRVQAEIKRIEEFEVREILLAIDNHQQFVLTSKANNKLVFLVDHCVVNSETEVSCSCMKMEHEGLPCTHILLVLHARRESEIPKCCIMQ